MKSRRKQFAAAAIAVACAPVIAGSVTASAATVYFSENFNVNGAGSRFDQFIMDDSAANDAAANYFFDFGAFDYRSTANNGSTPTKQAIPVAPRNALGDTSTRGLRLDVNNAAPSGLSIINLYPKLLEYDGDVLPTGDMKLTVDVFMDYNGPATGGGGSTEWSILGIQHQGGGIGGPLTTGTGTRPGQSFVVNGEGGNGIDWRLYKDNTRLETVDVPESGYVAPNTLTDGPADADNTWYTDRFPFLNPNPVDPENPDVWYETPGGIGKHWTTMEVSSVDGIIYYKAGGHLIAARTDESYTSGHMQLGYGDFNATVAAVETRVGPVDADEQDANFAIFDNIVLESVDAPARPKWNVNANGVWSNAGNWLNGVPNGIEATADFTNAISGGGKTVTLDANHTVRAMIFDNSQSYTINADPGAKIVFDSLTTGILGTIKVKSGNHTINAPIDTTRIVWTDVAAGGTLTVGGSINATTPLIYLKKTGDGTLNLNATNTWANNGLRMQGGTLNLNAANTWTAGDTVIDKGVVNLNAAGAIPATNGRLTMATGTTLNTNGNGFGASRVTVNNATITGAANITVEDHLFTSGTAAIAANLNFAPTLGFTGHRELVASGSTTLSGALGGTAKLHQFSTGSGSLTVSGASTFTQPLAIRGGALIVAANAPAGVPGPLGNSTAPVEVGDSTVTSLGTMQAATTAALGGAPTFNAGAGTFTWSTAPNSALVASIDGVSLANGNRILVKNQGTTSQNGVYERTSSDGTTTVWTRVAELNETAEFQYGTQATIGGGTVNSGRKYYLFAGDTLNTGTHSWVQELVNASLLTGGPVTIGRDVNVLDTTATAASVYSIGGNTAHNSTFSGTVTLSRATQLTAATGGTVNFTGNIVANGNNVTKAGAGNVVVKNLRAGNLTVSAGTLAMSPDATAAGASNVGALTISPGARLDLGQNKLITTTAAGTESGGIYSGVQGMVQAASNGGAWDQPGLTTSQGDAAGGLTSIGVATGEQILGLGPTDTALFAGQTITGASTVAMYTYAGDANMDGFISGDDYAAIDLNVAIPGSDGWYNGDFNYDGIISGDDYAAIDLNIVTQGAPFPTGGSAGLSGVAAVPEPASLGVIGLAASTLFGRRRRRDAAR